MESLNFVLSVLLSTFGIILLIVLIILGIRLIQVLNKVDSIIDDISDKVDSFSGLFHFIDNTTETLITLTDKVVSPVSRIISKIFNKNKNEEDNYE